MPTVRKKIKDVFRWNICLTQKTLILKGMKAKSFFQ